jgi:hypothetical protein
MHQPYHGHPLLPPWQAMDDNTRERSPAMPLGILWRHPDLVEVWIRQWERQQEAAHYRLVCQVRSLTWLQRLRRCHRSIPPVASTA